MEITTTTASSSSSSSSPCSPNEVAINSDDCVEDGVGKWLEDEALAGFRVWQLAGIILSILLALIVALCCCIKFRIPRTKQDIEADYIRKKITKNFRKELTKISNAEMDEMNLRKALQRVQADLDAESEELQKQQGEIVDDKSNDGLRARFHAMVHGMRARFTKNSHRKVPSNTANTRIHENVDNVV